MAGVPTGIPGIDTGGGSISAGGGGPSGADSQASVGYDSAFNVTFGGGKSVGWISAAPWIALAVVGLVLGVVWIKRK